MDSIFHSKDNKYFINYFNDSPNAGLIIDKSTNNIIDANNIAVNLISKNSKERIINQKISRFCQSKIQKNKSANFNAVFKTTDGVRFKASVSLSILKIQEKQFIALFFRETTKNNDKLSLENIDDDENKAYYDTNFTNQPYESEATFNKSGFIIGCNKELIELTNIPKDELIGKYFTELPFLNRKVKLHFLKHYKSLLAGDNLLPYYFLFNDKNNNKRNGVIRVSVIKNKDEVIGFQAILGDFTKQMRTRKTLIDNEAKFKCIFENLPVGAAYYNELMDFTDCNHKYLDIVEYKKEDLVGKNLLYFIDNNDSVKKIVEDTLKFGQAEYDGDYCSVITKQTKSVRGFLKSIKNKENENVGYITVIEDITDRRKTENTLRQSEKQLSLATKAANQVMWLYNCNKKELLVPKEQLINLNLNEKYSRINIYDWGNLIHPEYREQTLKAFTDYLNGFSSKFLIEYQIKNINGSYIWVLATGEITEWDANKKPTKMIGIITDISNLRRTEQQLIEKNKKLQESIRNIEKINNELEVSTKKAKESDKLKTAFLHNMSHEIRTPMNGIMGFSQLLEQDHSSPEKIKKYIKIIIESSNQLLSTVNDILDISKIETGQVDLYKTEFELNHTLDDLYRVFEVQTYEKNISLVLEKHTDKDTVLYSDYDRLRQILVNLISNAIKFTNKGKVRFGYTKNENKIIFFVKDTGIGIKKESLINIFDSFSQANSDDAVKYRGAGLGLSISKALVELLGGKICVESTPGIGSEFKFYLPIK